MPGASASIGREMIRSCPSAMSLPHDGVGSCTPAPRNESAASSTMLFAMISVKKTSTELAMFGSSSENMIRSGRAPCEIDASTNSFSRSDSTCPRNGRPMYGIRTYEITSSGIQRLPGSMSIRPSGEAVDGERGPERDPEQHDREGVEEVEEARDHEVDPAAEVAGQEREQDREEDADRRRADADDQRVAAAVEQAHRDVAPERVRAEHVAAAGAAPRRADRDRRRRTASRSIDDSPTETTSFCSPSTLTLSVDWSSFGPVCATWCA